MKFIEQDIPGVFIIETQIFGDARGYFMETYRKELFDKYIGKIDFIQDNESHSKYGVLRGLHFQKGEYSQAKLVRVLKGRVLDVAVDLRKTSPTFGQHIIVELSGENKRQLYIPRGFAHGFLVLSDTTTFVYKVDNIYSPQNEVTLLYNDPQINIQWPISSENMILSEKDKQGIPFSQIEYFK